MKKRFFFKLRDVWSCGVCATAEILAERNKPIVIFSADREKGTSSRKILSILRGEGLEAKPKNISIRNLKPYSILWYPPWGEKKKRGDHYVIFVKVRNGKYLIKDSVRDGPCWLKENELKKKWYRQYHGRMCGWVIEIKDPNGRG